MRFFNKRIKESKDNSIKSILSTIPPESAYAESFRTLRANLYFSVIDKTIKSILITSALQSEGKTNTAVNLGYTIAKTGKKVLLVDTDLRKPQLSTIFDLRGKPGLTDLVVDTLDQSVSNGSLDQYSLGDLIQLIKYQNLTGKLDIASGENKVTLYFKNGATMDAVWNNRPTGSSLLTALVRENLLSREQAKTAMELRKKTGRRIRTVLLSLGFITKTALEEKLAANTAEAIRIASTFIDGSFDFSQTTWNSLELSICPAIDFNILYREFYEKTEALTFINNAVDAVIHETDMDNLSVLGAGKIPPNPSEIINSERTGMMIDLLKQKFDFIIFDTSPVLPASDAMLMAPRTDGTMLVVRCGYSNKKLVKRVTDQFEKSNLPILGVVLNRMEEKHQDYYYQYYREYH